MENDPLMVLYPSDTLREMARLAFAVVAKYDIPLAPGQNAVIEALEYFADSGNEGGKGEASPTAEKALDTPPDLD